MTEDFFRFITDTTKDNFISSQKIVTDDNDYNPYSEDLNTIESLLDAEKYREVSDYHSVNILLSPRAHLYKNYAFTQLGKENEAKSELILAHKIIEGICATGTGTKEEPYFVTRISDEKDVLASLGEQLLNQSLVQGDGQFFDVIRCQSGNEIYFDITIPYQRMKVLMDNGKLELPFLAETKRKKWWEFWR